MNAIANIFNFRENDYNLVKNTEFLARSIFSSSANFGPLMTNNGALESWHWGKLAFCQKRSSLNFWQPERSRCRRTSTTIDCIWKIWVCCRLMRLIFVLYALYQKDQQGSLDSYVNHLFYYLLREGTIVSTSVASKWFLHAFPIRGGLCKLNLVLYDIFCPANIEKTKEYMLILCQLDPKRLKNITMRKATKT